MVHVLLQKEEKYIYFRAHTFMMLLSLLPRTFTKSPRYGVPYDRKLGNTNVG